jgi:hypothetical protein
MYEFIKTWGTLIGVIVTLGSGFIAVDARFAKAQVLQRLELRVDQKILVDRQEKIQERVWKYEDRYLNDIQRAPENDRVQWRKLIEEQKANEKELDLIKVKSMEKK